MLLSTNLPVSTSSLTGPSLSRSSQALAVRWCRVIAQSSAGVRARLAATAGLAAFAPPLISSGR